MSSNAGEAEKLMEDVFKAYTKDIELRLISVLKKVPAMVFTSALGNLLIRKCQKTKINKEIFLQQMSKAWDYHLEEEQC